MGLTTETAHLFIAADPPGEFEATVHAIRQFMAGTGFEEAAGSSDRTFTLVASPHWISIYDTETGSVDALVRSLSKTLNANATAIHIEDSDKYSARLCRAGRWVDKISGGVLRKKGTGKPELWAGVLAPGSEQDVARALQGQGAFAEEPLRHLCQALRLPAAAALQVAEEISAHPPEGARVLRYRSLHSPVPQGPPRLTVTNSGSTPAVVGQPLQQLFVAVANDGPTAKGVRIRFAGAALAEGFITLAEIHVVALVALGGGLGSDRKTYAVGREGQSWVVDLPTLELKARPDPRGMPSGAGMLKALKEYQLRTVYCNLPAIAARVGTAELDVRFEWLDGAGAPLEVRLPITIDASE